MRLVSIAASTITAAIAQFFDFVLTAAPPLHSNVFAGPALVHLGHSGHPIDAALMHSNRHEAGVSRRSAARNL